MVIVGPDQIFRPGRFRRCLSESAVYSLINLPELGIKIAARRHVVKQRPDDFVGEAGVELRDFVARQRNRLKRIRAAAGGFLKKIIGVRRVGGTRLADPETMAITPYAIESSG